MMLSIEFRDEVILNVSTGRTAPSLAADPKKQRLCERGCAVHRCGDDPRRIGDGKYVHSILTPIFGRHGNLTRAMALFAGPWIELLCISSNLHKFDPPSEEARDKKGTIGPFLLYTVYAETKSRLQVL